MGPNRFVDLGQGPVLAGITSGGDTNCVPTDHSFDAVLCVGGFNYFSDPLTAMREMARVARPGGRIVVADELPDLLGARPVRSELIYLLVSLDKQYTAEAPGEPWEIYYARQVLRHFQPSGG